MLVPVSFISEQKKFVLFIFSSYLLTLGVWGLKLWANIVFLPWHLRLSITTWDSEIIRNWFEANFILLDLWKQLIQVQSVKLQIYDFILFHNIFLITYQIYFRSTVHIREEKVIMIAGSCECLWIIKYCGGRGGRGGSSCVNMNIKCQSMTNNLAQSIRWTSNTAISLQITQIHRCTSRPNTKETWWL